MLHHDRHRCVRPQRNRQSSPRRPGRDVPLHVHWYRSAWMDALLCGLKIRLPLQNVKFALVGPFIWIVAITMTYRVSAHIVPLVTVAFRGPKLAVPMVALPNITALGSYSLCDDRFPISHPTLKGRNIGSIWHPEKMNVIRHHDVASYQPRRGLAQGADIV